MAIHLSPPQAIFLDRDGTLIENRHYLSSPEGVALLPGVCEALARVREAGAKLFLFANQSGVGRGYFTLADVEAVNRRMTPLSHPPSFSSTMQTRSPVALRIGGFE